MGFPWGAWWDLVTANREDEFLAIVKFVLAVSLIQVRYLYGIWRLLSGSPLNIGDDSRG